MDQESLEAPPGFEPGMEVLQIWQGGDLCCLVLVSGRPSIPLLRGSRALLDYIWTTTLGRRGTCDHARVSGLRFSALTPDRTKALPASRGCTRSCRPASATPACSP